MTSILLPDLPDESRVWIYGADRTLRSDETELIGDAMAAFTGGWQSHGRRVRSGAAILHGRFVLIAGLIPGHEISGCGIDASVHLLDEVGRRLDLAWADNLSIFFRDGAGQVQSVPRPQFRRLAREGNVSADTTVFDFTVETLGDIRRGAFEKPAAASWHGRVFRIDGATVEG